nr:nucleoside 2-deoxyribosyltransferase [Azomonas macrocytogenes]
MAGFDVFRTDAVAHGAYLKKLCNDVGLEGMYPFDNLLPDGLSGSEAAKWICDANVAMLSRADAVLANLEAFRGYEPDSGTVFEMGLAVAFDIPVWVYFPEQGSMRAQIPHDECGYCAHGYMVEDFGLPKNLMLACNWKGMSLTPEQAIVELAVFLARKSDL